jgi:hypothetical protein
VALLISLGWVPAAPSIHAHTHHDAPLLPDGRVFVAGDTIGGPGWWHIPDLYDPTTDTWSSFGDADVNWALPSSTATLLATGDVLVAGGHFEYTNVSNSATNLFHPATNSWSWGVPMVAAREGHTATRLGDGRVLVVGGRSVCYRATCPNPIPWFEVYDPISNT